MAIESKINITANDSGVSATVNRITKNFNEAERSLKGFGGGFSSTLGSMSSLLNPTIAVSAAITGVTSGLGMMVKSSIDTADKIYNMSQKVGISTEELSLLNYVAEMSDVDLESLGTTVAKLNRNISESSQGQGEASKAFRALGIDVRNVNGDIKTADIILMEIAERFQYLPDGPKKTALAMELMGRSGANMIPFLKLGADGIRELKKEAKELGLEISEEMGKNADSFNDKMFRLEKFVTGTAQGIARDLLPALETMADWFYDSRGGITEFVSESIKELNVLFYLLNHHTDADMMNFFSNGFDMVIPKAIRKTEEEMKVLRNEIMYVVDATGKVKEIKIVSDAELEKRKLAKLIEDTEAAERAAAQLKKEWNSVSSSLSKEIATIGLSGFDLEIVKIQQKVDDLYKKFGYKKEIDEFKKYMTLDVVAQDFEKNIAQMFSSHELGIQGAIWGANALKEKYKEIPGALEKINDLIFNLRINNVAPQLDIEKTDKSNPLTPVNFDRSVYDAQIEAITQVTDFETASFLIREQGTMDMFSNMSQAAMSFYNATGQKSKQMFALYKMFAIGETTISTIQAAQEAYKWAAGWGGPIAGGIAAAAASLAGAGRVAEIAATQPGSRHSGSSSGGSYNPTSSNNYNNNSNSNNTQNTYITLYTSNDDPDEILRKLLPAIEKFNKYNGPINIK